MLCARDAVGVVVTALREQVRLLVDLVERHRRTPMVARTLTQHAVPTTFGLKAAGWLTGVLDAYDAASALVLPVQVGGRRRHHGRHRRARGRPRRPGRRGDRAVARAGHRAGPDRLDAVAHHALHGHPARRRRRRLHRRLGPDRHRRADPQPTRDRRAVRRRAAAVVDHAAQGQPGPRHARPPDRAQPARASPPPSTSRPPTPATNARPVPGTPSGTPCARCCAGRSSPPARRPSCWPASRCTPTGWPPPSTPRATPYVPSSARWPSLAGRTPSGDYLGAADAFIEAPLARAAGVLA